MEFYRIRNGESWMETGLKMTNVHHCEAILTLIASILKIDRLTLRTLTHCTRFTRYFYYDETKMFKLDRGDMCFSAFHY